MAPDITDASVDFPAPEGPITPTNSPSPMLSDTSRSAASSLFSAAPSAGAS